MSNLSLLKKAKKEDVISSPFPYIVIRNALDEDLYESLVSSYPSDEEISGGNMGNNTRYQLSIKDSYRLSPLWREFSEYHSSYLFYKEFLDIFGDHIPSKLDWIKHSTTYKRKLQNPTTASSIALDCQIGINSPVTEECSVKSAHVDNRVELFAGLLYLRQSDDKSTGGDLSIYKPLNSNMNIEHKKEIDLNLLEKVDEVNYEANTFVLFLCSKYSIHGVSPRSVTPYSRRLVNVIGELSSGRVVF
jgi:hypothetical protein